MPYIAAAALIIALSLLPPAWAPAMPAVPPGGFATITIEGVRHGDRHVPPDLRLQVRSDRRPASILIRLNGQYITHEGKPFVSRTTSPTDLPQLDFVETNHLTIPIVGLAPGVHHLEIRSGVLGSSLPLINEHDIWFSVGD